MTLAEQDRRLQDFEEAISSWGTFVSPRDTRLANATWGETAKTYDGQVQLLLSAKAGDMTAINFLFLALQTTVSKALTARW